MTGKIVPMRRTYPHPRFRTRTDRARIRAAGWLRTVARWVDPIEGW